MLLAGLFISTAASAQSDIGESLVVELSNPGQPGRLKLHLVQGGITVTAYDGKEVIITPTARKHDDDCDDCDHDHDDHSSNRDGMTRINTGQSVNITVTQDNNFVNVATESWNSARNFDIKVPRNFDLMLKTVNEGNIVVRGVHGDHDLSNVNGEIIVESLNGSLVANTVNGDIRATFTGINKEVPMAFTTLNGNVDLTFPKAAAFNIKLQTQRGEVFTDFPWETLASKPKVERSSNGGTTRVKIEDWTYGKINGGGPEYLFKSFHGDIYIRQQK